MPKKETQAELQDLDDAPFYIRWSPDHSPYAIELRLDLVSQLIGEIARAEALGIEIGGVLIGSFPNAQMPTLRIDDVEMISRRPEDGPIYMLDPSDQQGFAEVRWKARAREKAAIGFFRSHIRPGPLRPALADRTLLSGHFSQAVYATLLVQAHEPRTAAFFVAANGLLPEEPSVREFKFDDRDFRALPEIQPDPVTDEKELATIAPPRNRWVKPIAIPLLIALGVLAVFYFLSKRTGLLPLPAPNHLHLAVSGDDHLLHISWNHAARELDRASGATLVIADGLSRQNIHLGADELKLGSVAYQPSTQQVQITMTVDVADANQPTQSAEWPGR